MKKLLLITMLVGTCLSGCKTVTLATPSNSWATGGAPFVSNGLLIVDKVSNPTEKISFGGVRTDNGRWELIQEIEAITQKSRKAFQDGKSSLEKSDGIQLFAEISLVLVRSILYFEARGQPVAPMDTAQMKLPDTLSAEAKEILEKNLPKLHRAAQAPSEDGILQFLTQIRDLLRKAQQAPEER